MCVISDGHQSVAHMTGTTRSIYAPSFDSVEILPDADIPKLTHPGKERPRLRKANFVKRPVITCETLLANDAADDDVALNQMTAPPAEKLQPYVTGFFFTYLFLLL